MNYWQNRALPIAFRLLTPFCLVPRRYQNSEIRIPWCTTMSIEVPCSTSMASSDYMRVASHSSYVVRHIHTGITIHPWSYRIRIPAGAIDESSNRRIREESTARPVKGVFLAAAIFLSERMEKVSEDLKGGDFADRKSEEMAGKSMEIQRSKNPRGFSGADKIDLKKMNDQLEASMRRSIEAKRPKESWEIDVKNLVIKEKIGQGGFATVRRGTLDGQDVAGLWLQASAFKQGHVPSSVQPCQKFTDVKLLDFGKGKTKTEAQVARIKSSFRQEAVIWHTLQHPNVTQFIGASVGSSELVIHSNGSARTMQDQSNICCVVLEYLPGGTLKSFLSKSGGKRLPLNDVINLALDLAKGLSYLHSKKIVHRDVKTENILLDKNRTLKISDFGVARFEAQNPQEMTGCTGTLSYMAPEVLDLKPYDRKCDVYSFGICLWEIYSCTEPYAKKCSAEIASAVVNRGEEEVFDTKDEDNGENRIVIGLYCHVYFVF
eukprot:Gb_17557 [translate_table: standard]